MISKYYQKDMWIFTGLIWIVIKLIYKNSCKYLTSYWVFVCLAYVVVTHIKLFKWCSIEWVMSPAMLNNVLTVLGSNLCLSIKIYILPCSSKLHGSNAHNIISIGRVLTELCHLQYWIMFLQFWTQILCLSFKTFMSPCSSSLCSSNTYKMVSKGAILSE